MLKRIFKGVRNPGQALRWMLPYDYVSPNLTPLPPNIESFFPRIRRRRSGNPRVPHTNRFDQCNPVIGLTTWDENTLLYNYALRLAEKEVLEIGCWTGWSTVAFGMGGARLTVIDPVLACLTQGDGCHKAPEPADPSLLLLPGSRQAGETCRNALDGAGLAGAARLIGGYSPQAVDELSARGSSWSACFIDGHHEGEALLQDAQACARAARDDALILFHDLILRDVGRALSWLGAQGWNCGVHYTCRFIGVAWRGSMEPLRHTADPNVDWDFLIKLCPHLAGFPRI